MPMSRLARRFWLGSSTSPPLIRRSNLSFGPIAASALLAKPDAESASQGCRSGGANRRGATLRSRRLLHKGSWTSFALEAAPWPSHGSRQGLFHPMTPKTAPAPLRAAPPPAIATASAAARRPATRPGCGGTPACPPCRIATCGVPNRVGSSSVPTSRITAGKARPPRGRMRAAKPAQNLARHGAIGVALRENVLGVPLV